ncbi:MAG: M20/M25/M40 family metallo-hydrolase [Acidobacteriota bacterium]|nr:M20/M25/M40 family metallo-hydrolase [Acidobacteriota bacterium]
MIDRLRFLPLLGVLATGALSLAATAADLVHHDLQVRLDPPTHRIFVRDEMTLGAAPFAAAADGVTLVLHEGLELRCRSEGWHLETLDQVPEGFAGAEGAQVPLTAYRLVRDAGTGGPVTLEWEGAIHHPLEQVGEEYQRSFAETPGLIGAEGVFLAGSSLWVPRLDDALLTFRLEARELPQGWDVVSQGGRTRHEKDSKGRWTTVWDCPSPTEEVYLVAGPWTEYGARHGKTEILAFLRTPDGALADRYLQATRRYLEMYEQVLPPFPYPSFSLVENFWETGYGMPGFTLLGSRIIRFPWILTSSYPHEILHNWWGNSVYVDAALGNWCEGLTAYMADHLLAEQRGEDALYRRSTLKKFTDMVRGGEDKPLVTFRSRHSAASEAVGYGKSLMLFHMARQILRDDLFGAALRRFAQTMTFERATFDHISGIMTAETGIYWKPFFRSWIERSGAAALKIDGVEATAPAQPGEPWHLVVRLRQVQAEEPFPFAVPVYVTLAGREEALVAWEETNQREIVFEIDCPSRPLRVDVDPLFDVMRRLDPLEVPPALSTLMGDKSPTYILPAGADEAELRAWRELAGNWQGPDTEPRFLLDEDIDALPAGTVWVLGRDNRFGPPLAATLAEQGVSLDESGIRVQDQRLPLSGHSLVLVARRPEDPAVAAAWIAADPVEAIAGLARKLPHYTRYSWLAFAGDEPSNVGKGLWTPLRSPLVYFLEEGAPRARFPRREPLATLPPAVESTAMVKAVEFLAAPALEGRGMGSPGLAEATAWVEKRFEAIGLAPAGGDGYRQSFVAQVGTPARRVEAVNLLGRIEGSDPALAHQPVILMAHLDHLGRGGPDVRAGNEGQIHPGADDNASGVAVLLEVARLLAAAPPPARPILVAVVTGEEFGGVGSRHMVASLGEAVRPFACVNLDTVGRLGDDPLLVIGAESAREWKYLFMGVGYTTGVPIEMAAEPLDSSDQVACIEAGIPGVQLFSGAHADYHRPTDTADKIDAAGLGRVVEVTRETLSYLAGRSEALHFTGASASSRPAAAAAAKPAARKATLGTLPDFAFKGPGVRIDEVMADSAATEAGLAPGDVIIGWDDQPVNDLRGYTERIRASRPGQKVRLTLLRGEEEIQLEITLRAR